MSRVFGNRDLAGALQPFRRELREPGTLPFFQRDVPADALVPEPFDQISQPVALRVQIRVIDLLRIAEQHDFALLADAGDDRLHLVSAQILRLVDDDELPGNGSSADISERLDLDAAEPH